MPSYMMYHFLGIVIIISSSVRCGRSNFDRFSALDAITALLMLPDWVKSEHHNYSYLFAGAVIKCIAFYSSQKIPLKQHSFPHFTGSKTLEFELI